MLVEPLEGRTLLAGLSVIESGGTTVVGAAGTSDTLSIALTEMPASKVVVDAISSDTSLAHVSPPRLTFTPANWNIRQTVTIAGVNNPIGSPTATITVSVNDALSDDQFLAVPDRLVTVNVVQDLTPPGAQGTAVLVQNPSIAGTQMLVITGTFKREHIQVNTQSSGNLMVRLNNRVLGTFPPAGISLITADGLAGNDQISIGPYIRIPAVLSGGLGNDHLSGGAGDDIVHGGAGNDQLEGGLGNDILTGDAGNDRLLGGPSDDIMIGGTTTFDHNDFALQMLLGEWTSGRPLDQRALNLRLGIGDFLDGSGVLLAGGATVFTSGHDSLNGGAGQNLIFAATGTAKTGKLIS